MWPESFSVNVAKPAKNLLHFWRYTVFLIYRIVFILAHAVVLARHCSVYSRCDRLQCSQHRSQLTAGRLAVANYVHPRTCTWNCRRRRRRRREDEERKIRRVNCVYARRRAIISITTSNSATLSDLL